MPVAALLRGIRADYIVTADDFLPELTLIISLSLPHPGHLVTITHVYAEQGKSNQICKS